MINAADTLVGQKYRTTHDIVVEVLEKRSAEVVVKALVTGKAITVSNNYQFADFYTEKVIKAGTEDITMSEETTAPVAEPKVRKVKKSNIVDEGLKTSLSVDEIVKNVLTAFPETPEKSVRNLVSVRRSKLKKTV